MSSTGLQRGQMCREATRRLFICVYSVLCRFMLPSATEELCFPEIGFPPVIPRDSGDSWGVPGAGACSLHSSLSHPPCPARLLCQALGWQDLQALRVLRWVVWPL